MCVCVFGGCLFNLDSILVLFFRRASSSSHCFPLSSVRLIRSFWDALFQYFRFVDEQIDFASLQQDVDTLLERESLSTRSFLFVVVLDDFIKLTQNQIRLVR